jgi:hypothetical protein
MEEAEGFTLLDRSVCFPDESQDAEDSEIKEDGPVTTGLPARHALLHDYASNPDPRLQAKVERLERENQSLLNRLAVLEAMVFQGEGESSAFLHRLGNRVGEVDRWIMQHERARNHIIRKQVPCGFVPDHSSGNPPLLSEVGSFGIFAPLFHGL